MANQDSTNASSRPAASGSVGRPHGGAPATWRDRCGIPSHGFAPEIPVPGKAGGPTAKRQRELDVQTLLAGGSRAFQVFWQHMGEGRPGRGRYGSGHLARQLAIVARARLAQTLSQTDTKIADMDGAELLRQMRDLFTADAAAMAKESDQDLAETRGGGKKD